MQPISSTTPYVLPADFFALHDWRLVAQLCSDTGTSIPDQPTLAANTNFLTILNAACGELESAALRSGIYAVADLQALIAENGVGATYMKKIICDIAMRMFYSRRSGPAPSEMIIEDYNAAMTQLENLSNGTRIFGFQQTITAGQPEVYQMQPYDQFNNNLVTAKWNRFFGIRQSERRWW